MKKFTPLAILALTLCGCIKDNLTVKNGQITGFTRVSFMHTTQLTAASMSTSSNGMSIKLQNYKAGVDAQAIEAAARGAVQGATAVK